MADRTMAPRAYGKNSGGSHEPHLGTEYTELTHDELKQLDTDTVIEILKKNSRDITLRFASGISGYYVRFSDSQNKLEVVLAGPHGPEMECAEISKENVHQLHSESEMIEFVTVDESPFSGTAKNS